MAMEILTSEQWRRIDLLLADGEPIGAIRLYREFTGLGLAMAKEAIYERARVSHPALAARMGQIADDERA